jgi:metaxin
LLPAVHPSSVSQDSLLPIPSNKFVKYAAEHGGKVVESSSMRDEAYQSLLDHRIRNAWVLLLSQALVADLFSHTFYSSTLSTLNP